jgi:hypothetical protein
VPAALHRGTYLGQHVSHGRRDAAIVVPAPVDVVWTARQTYANAVLGGGTFDHTVSRLRRPATRWRGDGVGVESVGDGDGDGGSCGELPPFKYLASFYGTVHPYRNYSRGIRQDLLAEYGGRRGASRGVLMNSGWAPSSAEYVASLANSRFCLCPPGWAAWSPRLYHAIASGCVPVLFDSPNFTMPLPFEDVVDWDAMVVHIPEGQHARVADYLHNIPDAVVCAKRAALAKWAPLLLWSTSPELPLVMTLAEAWRRVRDSK